MDTQGQDAERISSPISDNLCRAIVGVSIALGASGLALATLAGATVLLFPRLKRV